MTTAAILRRCPTVETLIVSWEEPTPISVRTKGFADMNLRVRAIGQDLRGNLIFVTLDNSIPSNPLIQWQTNYWPKLVTNIWVGPKAHKGQGIDALNDGRYPTFSL